MIVPGKIDRYGVSPLVFRRGALNSNFLLLCALALIAAPAFASGVAFQASSLPLQVRGEGLTETIGSVVLQATGSGTIPAGSSVTIVYSAAILSPSTYFPGTNTNGLTCSIVSLGGATCGTGTTNFATSASGSQFTVAFAGTVTFAPGDYLEISQLRMNINALGSGTTTLTATLSGASSAPISNPITFTQSTVAVASIVNPSIHGSIPLSAGSIQTCSIQAGGYPFTVKAQENYPAALTSIADEQSFTPIYTIVNGTQVKIAISNVPSGLAVELVSFNPSSTLQLSQVGPALQVSTGSALTWTFSVTSDTTSAVESFTASFAIGIPNGSNTALIAGSLTPIGTTVNTTATVSLAPSSGIVSFATNNEGSGTVATVGDCGGGISGLPPDNLIVTYAGTGIAGYSGDGGPARYAALNNPENMVFDSNGNLYVSESADNRVRMITPAGVTSTIAGGNGAGFSGDTGAATLAQLNYPIGLALDGSNNLYISDRGNQRIRKVALSTGEITTVAGNGSGGYNGDNIQATNAELNNVHGIASDSAGNLYLGDQNNNRVRKVSTSGIITTVAGGSGATCAGTGSTIGDGCAATAATLNGPTGVALDSTGTYLFVAENTGNRVREFTIGGNITTIAGNGTANFSGDGSAASGAKLNAPLGLSLDSSGNLYISDRGNQRIRVVENALFYLGAGIINTLAGNGTAGFSGDGGSPTLAELQLPVQAVVNPITGNLFITDWNNYRIRELIATPTSNPTPSLTSLYPSNVVAGSSTFTLTVRGSNFVPGATSTLR